MLLCTPCFFYRGIIHGVADVYLRAVLGLQFRIEIGIIFVNIFQRDKRLLFLFVSFSFSWVRAWIA